jgi:hypothetical protein
MRRLLTSMTLSMALAGTFGLLTGCGGDDSKKPDAQTAEHALGISPQEQKKTSEVTRDVTVIKETKVIDNKTGQTISDTKEATPVRVTKETEVQTDVNVKVGETKATNK